MSLQNPFNHSAKMTSTSTYFWCGLGGALSFDKPLGNEANAKSHYLSLCIHLHILIIIIQISLFIFYWHNMSYCIKCIIYTDGCFNQNLFIMASSDEQYFMLQEILLKGNSLRDALYWLKSHLTFHPPVLDILPIRNMGGGLPLLDDGAKASLIFSAIELACFISDETMHMLHNAARYTYEQHLSEDEAALLTLGNNQLVYVSIPLNQLACRLPKQALVDIRMQHHIPVRMKDYKDSICRLFKIHLPCDQCVNYVCLYTARDNTSVACKPPLRMRFLWSFNTTLPMM